MYSKFDAVVVGAGPGGYVTAIRLAQLGKKTAIIEREELGGECNNYGCIPSKAIIKVADAYHSLKESDKVGIKLRDLRVDLSRLQDWKESVIKRLRDGIEFLLRSNDVTIIKGSARLASRRELDVFNRRGKEVVEADNIVLATGSSPAQLPAIPFDGNRVIGFKEALSLREIPDTMLIVGGGAVGLEMGTAYAKLGSKVTVVEIMDQLMPGIDPEIARVVHRSLLKLGMEVYLRSTVTEYEVRDKSIKVKIKTEKDIKEIDVEKVLVSVGKVANTNGIGLENVGIETGPKGFIKVNEEMRTSVPNIYAIGDVTGPPFLAHKASKQGIVAAESIAGMNVAFEPRAMPLAIFTDPEIASVGMTENQARDSGYNIKVGKFPFSALGSAIIRGSTDGFVKVIADGDSGNILGIHIVGPHATDLISEASLAIEMVAKPEDVALTIHPHPTLPEAISEAMDDLLGRVIHVVKRSK